MVPWATTSYARLHFLLPVLSRGVGAQPTVVLPALLGVRAAAGDPWEGEWGGSVPPHPLFPCLQGCSCTSRSTAEPLPARACSQGNIYIGDIYIYIYAIMS